MSSSPTILHGITWNHTRGYLPLVAATQRFHELHDGAVDIRWEKRSLREFEATPVDELAAAYDLMIIDHPFVGYAAASGALLPLDRHLDSAFLEDQSKNSVGASHASYVWGGHLWALAVDAATPVACWRQDVMEKLGLTVPETWKDLIELAKRGHVELPAAPINCLMNFFSLCLAHGEAAAGSVERFISPDVGEAALDNLITLGAACVRGGMERNPIQSYEFLLAPENSTVAYIPFTYGYSNYARRGYSAVPLMFGDVVSHSGSPLRTTLGGTGLAISATTAKRDWAVRFARYAADPETQTTLACAAGGQPGHRRAWLDPENNAASGNYFAATLPALDRAWVRPRYNGYMAFQDTAGEVIHSAIAGRIGVPAALAEIDRTYRASLPQ